MKKTKQMLALLVCVVMVFSYLAIPASAEDLYYDLGVSYTKKMGDYCTIKYDVGSIMPYDDVRAATCIVSEGGNGYAKVYLVGANGNSSSQEDYSADASGVYDTLWCTVGSTDTATEVRHSGYTGKNTYSYYVYDSSN